MARKKQDPDLVEALRLTNKIELLFRNQDPDPDDRDEFISMIDRVSDILEDWIR